MSLPEAAEVVIRNLGARDDSIVTVPPDVARDTEKGNRDLRSGFSGSVTDRPQRAEFLLDDFDVAAERLQSLSNPQRPGLHKLLTVHRPERLIRRRADRLRLGFAEGFRFEVFGVRKIAGVQGRVPVRRVSVRGDGDANSAFRYLKEHTEG